MARSLAAKGLEPFLPVYRDRRQRLKRRRAVEGPFVPGYVFCHFSLDNRLPILIIPGVSHIIEFGKLSSPVEDFEIHALPASINLNWSTMPWPFLATGQMVRLEEVRLRGLTGLLTAVDGSAKVVVSINLRQRSVAVEVDQRWLCPVSPAANVRNMLRSLPEAS